MKILFFATYPTAPTGYSRIGNILSNFLAENGHDIYYLGISNFKNNVHINRFINPNIKLLDALEMEKINGSDELYGINVICELLDKIKPDILFLYNDVIVISRIFNKFIENKISRNFKIFVYLDLVYEYENISILNHINKFADLILVFSKCWKKNLMDIGLSKDKIIILHHGFDTGTFYPVDKIESKKQFGFSKDDFIILNTNRNNYRKAIDITIDAFVIFLKLKNCDSRIKLFLNMSYINMEVVGYDIYNLIKISCIKHNIDYNDVVNKHIFVNDTNRANHISDEKMNYLYNACDIGINTCIGEGFGLCNLEHGGIGKPQIISGVGALNDIFTNEYSTIITPVAELYISNNIDYHGGYIKICSSNDFANAMVQYFDKPELVDTHGKLSRQMILNNYDWNKILNELNKIINEFDYDFGWSQSYMGLKYHMEEAYLENNLDTKNITDNPPYAIFSKKYYNQIANLDHSKKYDYCFIGSINSCYEMRKWVIDFAKKYFTANSIFVNTDNDSNWQLLGDYDYSNYGLGFCPKSQNDSQSKSTQYRVVQDNLFYFQTMCHSNFVLCPAGDSSWSFRFYETLICKSIPVIESKKHSYRTKEESYINYEYILANNIEQIINLSYNDSIFKNTALFEQYHLLTINK